MAEIPPRHDVIMQKIFFQVLS